MGANYLNDLNIKKVAMSNERENQDLNSLEKEV